MEKELLILVGVSTIFTIPALYLLREGYKSILSHKYWTSTKGTVVSMKISAGYVTDSESKVYYPKIKYTYSVGSETYTANRICLSNNKPALREREMFNIGLFKVGGNLIVQKNDPIKVYYLRKKPSQCTLLQQGLSGATVIVAVLLVFASLFFWHLTFSALGSA